MRRYLILLLLAGCPTEWNYMECQQKCAPLKVEEYQPRIYNQREVACKCASPKDGYVPELAPCAPEKKAP